MSGGPDTAARPEPGSGEAVTDETLGSHNGVVGRGGWRIVSDQLREPNSGTVWLVYPPGAQKPSHLAFTEEEARRIVRGGDTPADETLEELETELGYVFDLVKAAKHAVANGHMTMRLQKAAELVDLDDIPENAVPALLAEVRRLRRENARLDREILDAPNVEEEVDEALALAVAVQRDYSDQVTAENERLRAENAELRRTVEGRESEYTRALETAARTLIEGIKSDSGYVRLTDAELRVSDALLHLDAWREAYAKYFTSGVESGAGTDCGSAGASGTGGEEAGGGQF